MAMRPVRAISSTPYGRSTSSKPSILSTVPDTSTMSDSGATSTTRPRKTLMSSIKWGRDFWSAATLMSARSRSRTDRSEMFSESSTSTSFSRLASRRCAPRSSVWATMVILATSSFSVGPTVSESILMARRRAREDTRFRTPGLFSTYAISVCMVFVPSLWLGRRFNQWIVRTANHVVQRRAGRNHRVNRVLLFDAKIDQDGVLRFARRANRRDNVAASSYAFAPNAESICQRGEIGSDERRRNIALVIEKFLPLANHA